MDLNENEKKLLVHLVQKELEELNDQEDDFRPDVITLSAEEKYGERMDKYVKLQQVQQDIQALQQQLQQVEQQIINLNAINQAVADLNKIEEGTEILVPLAAGVYAKAKLSETDKFYVNVGAKVNVPKKVQDVKKMLEEQAAYFMEMQTMLVQQMDKLNQEYVQISKK